MHVDLNRWLTSGMISGVKLAVLHVGYFIRSKDLPNRDKSTKYVVFGVVSTSSDVRSWLLLSGHRILKDSGN
jgi:hypothetical protein